jgi:hypothetical protein
MGGRLSTAAPALLASVLFAGTTGCAAQSCPAVYLDPIVHVDATAWAGAGQLTATVCVAADCVTATPISQATPDDLLGDITLPTGKATVRVRLTTTDRRALDQTTTADVTLTKPFGSGCAGREEIDLTVTKAGSVVRGRPAKLG